MRSMPAWLIVMLVIMTYAKSQSASATEEVIETLDVIEVPGTAVVRETRTVTFLEPDMNFIVPLSQKESIPLFSRSVDLVAPRPRTLIRDSIADEKGILTSVQPLKAERPPYPRFAREQGWEGVVVLRLMVNRNGTVDAVHTQKSSGYSIIDESAEQTVQHWQFKPAKDGEIPIAVTVDLPIRFDLNER